MTRRDDIAIFVRMGWLIVPLTLLATALSAFFSYSQPTIYESRSTFVARLDPTLTQTDDVLDSLDTLLNSPRVIATYCDVLASSSTIEDAQRLVGIPLGTLDFEQQYRVTCMPISESNVLELSVRGTNLIVIERLHQAIARVGVERANTLYTGAFLLETLDPVSVSPTPIAPNHITHIALGTVLGFVLSFVFAYSLHVLTGRVRQAATSVPVGSGRTSQRALAEKLQRTTDNHRVSSIAFVEIIPPTSFAHLSASDQADLIEQIALAMREHQPLTHTIAYRGDKIFEILMPERSGQQARRTIQNMVDALDGIVYRQDKHNMTFSLNAVVMDNTGDEQHTLSLQARGIRALGDMDTNTRNTIVFLSAVEKHSGIVDDTDFIDASSLSAPTGGKLETDELSTRKLPDFSAKDLDSDEGAGATDVEIYTTGVEDDNVSLATYTVTKHVPDTDKLEPPESAEGNSDDDI